MGMNPLDSYGGANVIMGKNPLDSYGGANVIMGKNPLDSYGAANVTVVRVEIKARAIDLLQSFGDVGLKGLGEHDFLVITVLHENSEPCVLLAEKTRKPTRGECGTSSHTCIVLESDYSSNYKESCTRFVWEQLSLTLSATKLKEILNTTGGHYQLFAANCWGYATDMVEVLWNRHFHCLCGMDYLNAAIDSIEVLLQLDVVRRLFILGVARFWNKPFSRTDSITLCRTENWCILRVYKFCNPKIVSLTTMGCQQVFTGEAVCPCCGNS